MKAIARQLAAATTRTATAISRQQGQARIESLRNVAREAIGRGAPPFDKVKVRRADGVIVERISTYKIVEFNVEPPRRGVVDDDVPWLDNRLIEIVEEVHYDADTMDAAELACVAAADYFGLPVHFVKETLEEARAKAARAMTNRAKAKSRPEKPAVRLLEAVAPPKSRVGPDLTAVRLSAAYEALQKIDLDDRELAEDERLRLAGNIADTYQRLRKRGVKPAATDTLRAARRILKAQYRERQRAKLAM